MVDFALLFGAAFGPFILAGWIFVAALRSRGVAVWLLVVEFLQVVIAAVTIARYWFLWGVAFDHADADLPVPAHVDRSETTVATIATISVTLLVALTVIGLWSARSYRAAPRSAPIGP